MRYAPILLLMLVSSSPLFGQSPAPKTEAGAYLVPFATKGNRIELTVANEAGRAYEEIEVRATEVPVWVLIGKDPAASGRDDIASGENGLFAFTFSTDDSAPTEEVHTLTFEVYSDDDLVATKQIDIALELPKKLILRGNYPNPFNPSTTIGFVQPEDGELTLEIFDALGRSVDRLYETGSKRGQQTLRWNATTHASGVYFYRLELRTDDGVKETRLGKMMLIK